MQQTPVAELMCIILAFLLFILSFTTYWWPASPQPRHHSLISLGLAFLVLGVWLVPLMVTK